MTNLLRGRIQQKLANLLGKGGEHVEVRLDSDAAVRPDVAVFAAPLPPAQSVPPIIAVEVGSPEVRWYELSQKLDKYQASGVKHIWLVATELKRFYVYDKGSLTTVAELAAPSFGFRITAEELFA